MACRDGSASIAYRALQFLQAVWIIRFCAWAAFDTIRMLEHCTHNTPNEMDRVMIRATIISLCLMLFLLILCTGLGLYYNRLAWDQDQYLLGAQVELWTGQMDQDEHVAEALKDRQIVEETSMRCRWLNNKQIVCENVK